MIEIRIQILTSWEYLTNNLWPLHIQRPRFYLLILIALATNPSV